MSASKNPLEHGRASFDRRAWAQAFDAFVEADGNAALERDDLERLAWSAGLRGLDEAFLGALERLYNACLEVNESKRAARAGFWLGFRLAMLGSASAAGWLARAQRLVDDEIESAGGSPCAERGYLLVPNAFRHLETADLVTAQEEANEAARIGELHGDRDLIALARTVEGRALIRQGRIERGLSLVDEVMVAVTSGDLSPLVAGIVYCTVIVGCHEIQALDRARQWTLLLTRWCDEQPELVTFTGLCLVHRAELMQLGGSWADAMEEVRQLRERSNMADPEVFGDAWYRHGELLRLRGDFAEAEEAYRVASDNGREPQPGLALLRLAQGQTNVAASAIRRVLSTTTVTSRRASLLPAYVEIMTSTGELDDARNGCRELEDIARELGSEILGAMASHARGAVRAAENDHRGAIEPLRHAFGVWNRVGAPYLAARIRVLVGRSFVALGDRDGAQLELDAARKVFEELGAAPELAALDAATPTASGSSAAPREETTHGLSKREREVLRLLVTGKTNKAIARELFVSERTVDRHVANMFSKIGVNSRAAATAFAYEKKLV